MEILVLLAGLTLAADPPSPAPGSAMDVVTALETALSEAIARAEPSVVAIAREKGEDETTTAVRGKGGPAVADPFGADQISFDYGSGVVVGSRGEIVTAFHVVRGAKRLHVRAIGKQSFEAEVLAADPRSDLAVIVPRETPGTQPPQLTPLRLGDTTKLRKGAFLVALGNPFNAAGRDGRPSASWGILSNVARRLELAPEEPRPTLKNYPTLLQLDAKLNLGMSGGAVINLKGELVGITTNSASADGFDAQAGYAIPMDDMGRRAVETLMKGKEVEYGFLGIGLDTTYQTNRVTHAQPGTPAAEGELQADDSILSVGDTPVSDMDSLVVAINSVAPGTKLRLTILRRGQVLERTVELAKYHVEGEVIATNRPAPWRGLRVDYTSILPRFNLGPGPRQEFSSVGVVVTEVEPGSPAAKAGLKKDQVIKSIEGTPLHDPHDFAEAVANRKGPVNLETDLGPVTLK
jgi:S1-C subfamily serine protease